MPIRNDILDSWDEDPEVQRRLEELQSEEDEYEEDHWGEDPDDELNIDDDDWFYEGGNWTE